MMRKFGWRLVDVDDSPGDEFSWKNVLADNEMYAAEGGLDKHMREHVMLLWIKES